MEEDIVKYIEDAAKACNTHSVWIKGLSYDLKDCFAMIQKHAVSCEEAVSYYWKCWLPYQLKTRNLDNAPEEVMEKFKKDYKERLLIVVRSAVIFTLSIVEYVMKITVKDLEGGPLYGWYFRMTGEKRGNLLSRFFSWIMDKLGMKRQRFWLYLSRIMKESKKRGLIGKSEHRSWNDMIELRNAIVHNNAISDKTRILQIGDLKVIRIMNGKMIQMPLTHYPQMVGIIVLLTRNWMEAYFKLLN